MAPILGPIAQQKKDILQSGIALDPGRFTDLFSAAVGWSSVTQSRASDFVVMGRGFGLNFETALLSFGGDNFPMQLLGTESEEVGSWQWGWASSGIKNDGVLQRAKRFRAFGDEVGLDVFSVPQFELTQRFNGYNIAAVAAMLDELPACFYRCPYDGGAAYVLFYRLPESVFLPVNINVFMATVMQLAQQVLMIDHKVMVQALLYQCGIPFSWEGGVLVARFLNKPSVRIAFDEYNRVVGMDAK